MTAGVEPMSDADAANLSFGGDGALNAFLLTARLGPGGFVSQGGGVDLYAARRALLPRLGTIPRLRERPERHFGRDVWVVDDAGLDRHIVLGTTVLDEADFADRCRVLLAAPLPRDRPLWDLTLFPGSARRGARAILRVHHAVADGLAVRDVLTALMDAPPAGAVPSTEKPTLRPETGQGPVSRRADGFSARVPDGASTGARVRNALIWIGALLHPPPRTVLLGPDEGRHDVAFVDVPLAAFAEACRADGGTVNDGILAVVAIGLHAAVGAAGDPMPWTARVSVPVALPRAGASGNALAVALVPVPLGLLRPAERVAWIARHSAGRIARARAGGPMPRLRGRWANRLMAVYTRRQRLFAAVSSDVPGPDVRGALAGTPVHDVRALGSLGGNIRVSIVACSYAGVLSFGVHTGGPIHAAVVADAVRAGADELVDGAAGSGPGRG